MTYDYIDDSRQRDAHAELDQALDAMVRGDRQGIDRLDPKLRATVTRMYALADLSGITAKHDRLPVAAAPEGASKPIAHIQTVRYMKRRRPLMSTSSIIAATIVIAVGLYAAIPAFNADRGVEEPTYLALEAAVGSPSPQTILASGDGDQESAEDAADASSLPEQDSDVSIAPLSLDDCTVEPRPREEVLDILGTAPADNASIPGPWEFSVDQSTIDELNHTLRGWQACVEFGQTWQAMSLETEQYIREDIYGSNQIVKPYSESTLNEILDGRELVDANRAERMSNPEVARDRYVAFIDPNGEISISRDETFISAEVIMISPTTGEQFDPGIVDFALEDGEWRIRSTEHDFV